MRASKINLKILDNIPYVKYPIRWAYDTVAGGLTAGLVVAGKHAFKEVKYVWYETLILDIENAIKSGTWYPGR